jgi:protein-S-isoprenylcysteine O-methyltransferase Ste14
MYASLLALAWGAFFQDPSTIGMIVAGIASFSLWLTAVTDERECLAYFGDAYAAYMQRTKRFIPFLL